MASQPPGAPPDGESLRQLAEQKESEWRQLQQLRLSSLEAALAEREKELAEEKARFSKLKEDFKYNLKLLNERTSELENYDTVVAELKSSMAMRDVELSELKIELDSKQTALVRETKARDDLQHHYQHRIHEKQAELDRFRHNKEAEVNKERDELEALKRNLQRQLHEVEEELELQKQEITAGFEEAMRKREHEYRLKMDEMSSTVLAHELKVKLLGKELEVAQASQQKVSEEALQADEGQRNMTKQLKQMEWQLEDVTAMKDARITELESKVYQAELSTKRMQEEYKRKHEELDRYGKEKQMALTKAKEAAQEQQKQLMGNIRDLQSHLEDVQVKARQLEWSRDDALKDKDALVERLQEELSDLQGQLASQVQEVSRDTVARDMELQALRDGEGKLKAELQQCKQDIGRYKKELLYSAEREAGLERSKAQLELDWQRRFEDVEHNQYERSEDLIKKLTQSRDKALAELKEAQRLQEHQADLVSILTRERDQARATLKQHGLVPDMNVKTGILEDIPTSDSEQVAQLVSQNENLREVIRQMRQQMEILEDNMPSSKVKSVPRKTSVADEYVKNLEEEMLKLKTRCHALERGMDGSNTARETDIEDAVTVASNNPIVKTHIQTLNETVGSLRGEKMEFVAQIRKQQARIHHMETKINDLTKQPQQQQIQLEQLQYELGAQSRRHQAESASLRQRVSDLELQLAETRREADEYHRSNIESNLHTTALENEVSTLKMDLAEKRPPVTFGAQELMIQQLQDEIQHLQKQLTAPGQNLPYSTLDAPLKPHGSATASSISQLQERLRQAARHISQLAREKQQLIEVGNRLRAELKRNGLKAPVAARNSFPTQAPIYTAEKSVPVDSRAGKNMSGSLRDRVQNKLKELENLQYDLTRQQLALTEKVSPQRGQAVEVASSSDSQDNDDWQPQSILKKSTPSVTLQPNLSPVPEDAVFQRRPASRSGSFPQPSISKADAFPSRPSTAHSDRSSHYGGSPSRSREGALLMSISSVGGESLADVWKLLDEDGTSPRPFTPLSTGEGPFQGLQYPGDYMGSDRPRSADKSQRPSREANSFTLQGKKAEPRPKSAPQMAKLSPRTAGKPTKKSTSQKSKIRNYNVKDSS